MANASWAIGSFLGGEISAFAQGRFDKPEYRTSMQVCLNGFPVEIGAWARRPGTQHAGHSKNGSPARTIKFDFEQSAPITLEFTDSWMRWRNGAQLSTSNDPTIVVSISAANPGVVQLAAPVIWQTGQTAVFPGVSTPLLENRQFRITQIDTTHFTLADPLTGVAIDGSTLGALAAGATMVLVAEAPTLYTGGVWANIRPVQAETTDILLCPGIPPQAVTVRTLPTPGVNAELPVGAVTFNDGPYLDPFINGVQATPGSQSGIITLSLSFPLYSATKAYALGAFVTSGPNNYISLQDQNVNNVPGLSPAFWTLTSPSAAINDGKGFLGTDIGRLVRLLSEPPAWDPGAAYVGTNVVSYNPSGQAGAAIYYQALTANTDKVPGADLTNWALLPTTAAVWTWGKIVSLSNIIDRILPNSSSIGSMTGGGGLDAAFDGNFAKGTSSSANAGVNGGAEPGGTDVNFVSFIGKNYASASAQAIEHVTIYPSTDIGLASVTWVSSANLNVIRANPSIGLNLRAKQTAPTSSSDGVLLGSTGSIGNSLSAITIISNDQTTTWNYVWVEMGVTAVVGSLGVFALGYNITNIVAQLSFFNPPGSGTGSGINVEILGAPLLYTTPIITWRLGVYSNTTGWPTCGIYNDGRLFLGGAVNNRFDACVSNGINGAVINFAPTDQSGAVAASSAISYVFNSDGVNQIEWMKPDLQGVLMGTKAGEWLVQAPTAGSIAPNNITARNVTHHGGANIQPVSTEHTTVFVQRFARKLLEYFPDVYSGKFTAPNLADKAAPIVRAGIAELAYTSAVTPIIWGRDVLGALFGITYKRDTLSTATGPTFAAWHRHQLGSGRVVESICAGPSTGGDLDSLTMVTNDAATNIRHVEVLTDVQDELAPLALAWFLDDAVTPSSMSQTSSAVTLNGLWHLNGKVVQVFAGGLDLGDTGEGRPFSDFTVANGSVTIPFGDGISTGAGGGLFTAAFLATNPQIVVGFTYTSQGQVVRPISQADSGARSGPAFAKISRGHWYGMRLVNTLGLSVGGDLSTQMFPCAFRKRDGITPIDPLTAYTGVYQDALRDDYDRDTGAPAWQITRPFPANIVALGTGLSTQDQ